MRNTKKDTSPLDSDLTPVDFPAEGCPLSSAPPPPPQLDLARYSEATRRALYDVVVAVHFSPTEEQILRFREDPDAWVEIHSPEEAELVVFYTFGRWFAAWRMLDEPADAPASFRWEMMAIRERPGAPYGVGFSEV